MRKTIYGGNESRLKGRGIPAGGEEEHEEAAAGGDLIRAKAEREALGGREEGG